MDGNPSASTRASIRRSAASACPWPPRRRAARTITSELLEIPGVGPNKRRKLLETFGSLAGVKSATATEIAAVPGFSQKLATRVLEHLKEG